MHGPTRARPPPPSHYDTLAVSADATPEEIHAAFRALAKKYHPDKAPPDLAAEHTRIFAEINNAHKILSDADSRLEYDAARRPLVNQRPATSKPIKKYVPICITVGVSLKDAYNGVKREINFTKTVIRRESDGEICPHDDAAFATYLSPCSKCGGSGRTRLVAAFPALRMACEHCSQTGLELAQGYCVSTARSTHELVLHPGISNGDYITLDGFGNHHPGFIPGDVTLRVHVADSYTVAPQHTPPTSWSRIGHDLHTIVEIPLVDAISGGAVRVPTLDPTRVLYVEFNPPVQYGEKRVIRGEGMPVIAHGIRLPIRGNIVITFAFIVPAGHKGARISWEPSPRPERGAADHMYIV